MTKEEKKKENWLKKHPIWSIVIFFLILGLIVGFSEKINTKTLNSNFDCEDYINLQIPNSIIFNKDFTINNTWLDGTEIKTLKDYREIKEDGILTTAKTGSFNFYKGNKPGQNANLYYIESKIYETDIAGSSIIAEDVFYLEYSKEQGTTPDVTILPNKYFKIIPKDYTITFDGNSYYLKINSYEQSCNNIN